MRTELKVLFFYSMYLYKKQDFKKGIWKFDSNREIELNISCAIDDLLSIQKQVC